ncbi:MAG: ATP-binding cassette domain-containing protein, partial [Methanomicrobiales archaeon]|nr:ATP-binding cassette domain-containing protein [Methanomicrobiales archaeon]
GKTTTIRILTGITRPTGGTARVFGHDIITETIESRRHMGIVHETSNVYDELTAWQNLIFTADLYHVPKAGRDEWARQLLETFDLLERKDDLAHGFSKGMKRRLTLAMGLINHPRLLFLDEPTSGLDVQSNLIIRRVIRDLAGEGVTVFLTTHNIEEANLTCDRVAIIDHGRIAAIDSPERLKKAIQSVQSVEVGFDRQAPEIQDELRRIPTVNEIRKEGDKIRLFTNDPSVVIPAVIAYAEQGQMKVLSLTTYGPSLEDVFIRLTGIDAGNDRRSPWK